MLRAEREGALAVWTIERPAAKNALDSKVLAALDKELDRAKKDRDLRVVILTGAGDAFSSGGDLQELRTVTGLTETEKFCDLGRGICKKMEEFHVPIIASLSGVAYGGGAELALACDMRIADPAARISFKQARMGVTTAWGTLARLVSIVGHGTASRLLFTTHEVGAKEAKKLGLVDEVSDKGMSLTVARAWAHDIIASAPKAVADMKELMKISRNEPAKLDAEERKRFILAWTGQEHADAVEAYFARRPSRWPGK
ncbi:MAG: enoyl-CoA hydratase/isomerase family protein [Polyangiaceae bacterium]